MVDSDDSSVSSPSSASSSVSDSLLGKRLSTQPQQPPTASSSTKLLNLCLLARHTICSKLDAQFFDELVANSFARVACPGGYRVVKITGTTPLSKPYELLTGEKDDNRKIKCKFEFMVQPGDRPIRLNLFSNSKATEDEIA